MSAILASLFICLSVDIRLGIGSLPHITLGFNGAVTRTDAADNSFGNDDRKSEEMFHINNPRFI